MIERYNKRLVDFKEEHWEPETCTAEDGPTDAYGEIRFNNQENKSKFIRVDHKTDMNQLISLLFNYWKLEPPKLLISG